MLKSKITGSVQELILPDFPDDDNTVTATVTKSRRVSFGTNLVKEFIVGSAISSQCLPEYEQAFPSSDSSNADSSQSGVESGILDHKMFIVHDSHKVYKPVPSVEPEVVESRSKLPKFSSTVCFNADSPTADMEFTEGCITLAKSILDKKNKEMTVIIQAKPKETKDHEKLKEEETKYFDGSQFDMNVTRCLKSKLNKREEKKFDNEKTKIFSKYENEMSVTRCNGIFNADDSDSSWEDSKENRMPLDMIMRHLDKDSSDLEDDLFNPEKTFSNFLNLFDASNESEKLNLNESMEISSDFPPNIIKLVNNKSTEQRSTHEACENITEQKEPSYIEMNKNFYKNSKELSETDFMVNKSAERLGSDESEYALSKEKQLSVVDVEMMESIEQSIQPSVGASMVNKSALCVNTKEPNDDSTAERGPYRSHFEVIENKEERSAEPSAAEVLVFNKSIAERMNTKESDDIIIAEKEATIKDIEMTESVEKHKPTLTERAVKVMESLEQQSKEVVVASDKVVEILQQPNATSDDEVQESIEEQFKEQSSANKMIKNLKEKSKALLAADVEKIGSSEEQAIADVQMTESSEEAKEPTLFVLRVIESAEQSKKLVNVEMIESLEEPFEEHSPVDDKVIETSEEASLIDDIVNKSAVHKFTKEPDDTQRTETQPFLTDVYMIENVEKQSKEQSSAEIKLVENLKEQYSSNPAEDRVIESTDEQYEGPFLECLKEPSAVEVTVKGSSGRISTNESDAPTAEREPSLADVKVIETLEEQSKEPHCVWSLKNFCHPQAKSSGWLSFKCKILESSATLQFIVKISNEDSLDSCSTVINSEISPDEENSFRPPEYKLVVNFGFEKLKKYFEERRTKVKSIRRIPYFLDEINSFTLKANAYLKQVYSILTLYPGSGLKGSLLSFRLYSFPVFFSSVISIDLSDLFRLSDTSLSFEDHFGNLDKNKIREIFKDCLKLKNFLCEFVVQSTKYIIDLEKGSGFLSKRGHIRLLPDK